MEPELSIVPPVTGTNVPPKGKPPSWGAKGSHRLAVKNSRKAEVERRLAIALKAVPEDRRESVIDDLRAVVRRILALESKLSYGTKRHAADEAKLVGALDTMLERKRVLLNVPKPASERAKPKGPPRPPLAAPPSGAPIR